MSEGVKDIMGIPLNIGDLVVYAKTEQNTNLYLGTVVEITTTPNKYTRNPEYRVRVLGKKSNSKVYRYPSEVASLVANTVAFPEYFL